MKLKRLIAILLSLVMTLGPVSYTHLDVYKRQDVAGLKTDMTDLKGRVARLEDCVDELREAQEETRDGVNVLLEWAEACGNVIKFPLPRIK